MHSKQRTKPGIDLAKDVSGRPSLKRTRQIHQTFHPYSGDRRFHLCQRHATAPLMARRRASTSQVPNHTYQGHNYRSSCAPMPAGLTRAMQCSDRSPYSPFDKGGTCQPLFKHNLLCPPGSNEVPLEDVIPNGDCGLRNITITIRGSYRRGRQFLDCNLVLDFCSILASEVEHLERLNAYAVQVRYPGDDPTLEEAREAVEIAQAVRRWARSVLRSISRERESEV
jgi:hypothetical protein